MIWDLLRCGAALWQLSCRCCKAADSRIATWPRFASLETNLIPKIRNIHEVTACQHFQSILHYLQPWSIRFFHPLISRSGFCTEKMLPLPVLVHSDITESWILLISCNDWVTNKKRYRCPCFWGEFAIRLGVAFWKVSMFFCWKQDYGIILLLTMFQNWLMHLMHTGQTGLNIEVVSLDCAMPTSVLLSSNVLQCWGRQFFCQGVWAVPVLNQTT